TNLNNATISVDPFISYNLYCLYNLRKPTQKPAEIAPRSLKNETQMTISSPPPAPCKILPINPAAVDIFDTVCPGKTGPSTGTWPALRTCRPLVKSGRQACAARYRNR